MTVDEVILQLVRKIGLKNDAGYGLFEALSEDMAMPVKGEVFIRDILRKFEMNKRGHDDNFGNHFLFKKRLNLSVKAPTDYVELDLVYAEVCRLILSS